MADHIKVTGMVLSEMSVGEYNKRLVILTKECGKIHGFVRGAKKPGNAMMAVSQPFVFGEFQLVPGKDSYNIVSARVERFFEEILQDMTATCYGCYFLELADYYGRENANDFEMLKLLYITLLALSKKIVPYGLIRRIYELRLMTINGEGPVVFECAHCHNTQLLKGFSAFSHGLLCEKCFPKAGLHLISVNDAVVYTLQYILTAPLEKLYSFKVSPEVMQILSGLTEQYRKVHLHHTFKSLDVLMVVEDL